MALGTPSFVNYIEINPRPTNLLFITRAMWKEAHVITLDEYRDDIVRCHFWSSDPGAPEIHQPAKHLLFKRVTTNDNINLNCLLGPKALVIHELGNVEIVHHIIRAYQPDLIICAAQVSLEGEWLSGVDHSMTLVRHKLPGRFENTECVVFGNEFGSNILNEDIVNLDVFYNKFSVAELKDLELDKICLAHGFWPLEKHKIWQWAWTGPTNSSIFFIPVKSDMRQRLTLFFIATKVPIDGDNIAILIDGRSVKAAFYPDLMKVECTYSPPHKAFCSQVEIRIMCPVVVEDHSRRVGVALHKVGLEDVE